jgi:hypothetical protein
MPPVDMPNQRALGTHLADFQERFNLHSLASLARVLGTAVATARTLVMGQGVPRDATLYQLAARMNDHAESKGHPWRTSFDELRAARDLDAARAREAS